MICVPYCVNKLDRKECFIRLSSMYNFHSNHSSIVEVPLIDINPAQDQHQTKKCRTLFMATMHVLPFIACPVQLRIDIVSRVALHFSRNCRKPQYELWKCGVLHCFLQMWGHSSSIFTIGMMGHIVD